MRRLMVAVLSVGLLAGAVRAAAEPAVAPPPNAYSYLDNPRMVGEGQQAPHAELRPYADIASAARHGEQTPYTSTLDGQWKIAMADRPQDVPAEFYAAGYDVGGWRSVTVPHTWQTDELDHPMFRNIAEEMWPDRPPFAPKDINPTGAYVRDFQVPAGWAGRSTFLRFEGVTAGYFVWVNGNYVGYDQGGYTPAEFDISAWLKTGTNRIAVQVHRWGAGSYLEDYDQWRFSGIFRSVWLYSAPKAHIRDVSITTDLNAAYTDATLSAKVSLAGPAGRHTVRAMLYDPAGREVSRFEGSTESGAITLSAQIRDPVKWTDETPDLYTLVLTHSSGHITSERLGFREITIANRQLLVNGKPVLFKGVNRTDTDPDHGRHVPRSRHEQDVRLMKQLNVNAVRTAHYPSDPYFYDLADQHGIWIDDEVDVETHAHETCPSNCLADLPEWQDAFLDRFVGMVQRDKNHPSVFLWDTGNEAGLGKAHYAMADWATRNEPSRPLYHQSNLHNGDAPYAPVWGPRYPTPDRLRQHAAAATKPVILGEYAHAMGNSLGNFREFWDIIRANPHLQGGFIWDWAEQNIRRDLLVSPDGSGNGILAHLSGLPAVVDGHRGKGLSLSGLDDFVEVYRDPKLDIVGTTITLDAWVKPDAWTGSFPIIAKGNHSYALKMKNQSTVEFFVHSGGYRFVQATVPADFYGNWHRVTGTYDGTTLRLYIDGKQVATAAGSGAIDRSAHAVNIGRDSETMKEGYNGRMAHGTVDDVRIYDHVLAPDVLAAGGDPAADAVLALDFDRINKRGTYLSYGASTSGVDGLVSADREPQPETRQLAHVHQPLQFSYANGLLSVHNEQRFAAISGGQLNWKVLEGARTVTSGRLTLSVGPGATTQIPLPAPANPANLERWLTVESGSSFDQFSLGGTRIPGGEPPNATGRVQITPEPARITLTGTDFRYVFDRAGGQLSSMSARGTELLKSGPKLDAWRAPISNETFSWAPPEADQWRAAGLERQTTTAGTVTARQETDGSATVTVTSTVVAPDQPDASFTQTMTYRVDAAGTIRLQHNVSPQGRIRTLPYLPRIGVSLAVPDRFQQFTWYGRGPAESYNDRKDGTPHGVHMSTVDSQYVDYHHPQDYGNHTDTRWALLTDRRTGGLLISGATDVSVTPHDNLDRAAYPFQLKRNPGWFTLHAAHAASGVGDTPNPTLSQYLVKSNQDYSYTMVIRPLSAEEVQLGAPKAS